MGCSAPDTASRLSSLVAPYCRLYLAMFQPVECFAKQVFFPSPYNKIMSADERSAARKMEDWRYFNQWSRVFDQGLNIGMIAEQF
jgi:hypothetical protein